MYTNAMESLLTTLPCYFLEYLGAEGSFKAACANSPLNDSIKKADSYWVKQFEKDIGQSSVLIKPTESAKKAYIRHRNIIAKIPSQMDLIKVILTYPAYNLDSIISDDRLAHFIPDYKKLKTTLIKYPMCVDYILDRIVQSNTHFARLFPTLDELEQTIRRYPAHADRLIEKALSKAQFIRLFPTVLYLSLAIDHSPTYYADLIIQKLLNDHEAVKAIIPSSYDLDKITMVLPTYAERITEVYNRSIAERVWVSTSTPLLNHSIAGNSQDNTNSEPVNKA
ncbi:MAG: hypothetical protein Q7V63_05150 [Gammaproteobacteria bacterium]|nr:hypothetical protein [Gammaproteobacteria bacterium]